MQLRMPSLAVLTSLVLLAASELVVAQIMGPDCNVTMDWSFNSLGQSPCIVAAYMLATCNDSVFILQPLQPGNSYTVSGTIFDYCLCTSVAYNLLSVCDACQGQNWRAWSNYSSNCSDRLSPLPFPYSVPLGTRVPQWALVDHTLEENWNATKAGIDTPEIEPGSLTDPGSTSPNPNGDDFSSSSNGPNTGTIVGSIVGGVAALATIGALLFYFLRKRQRSQVPSVVVDDVAPPMSHEAPSLSAGDESDKTYVRKKPVALMKLYDPNDPGTFPEYQRVSTSVQVVRVSVAPKDGSLNGNTLTTVQAAFTPGYHGLPTV